MSSNAPKVLVINYDEKGDYAKNHEDAKESILAKIRSDTWDFIFLCTQKSLSNLISLSADTMQHVIGEEIKKNPVFSDNYTLFSKIDATRPLNSKKVIFSNDKKFRNVRIRCWRNVNIPMPTTVNEMALKSTSYKISEESNENMYNTPESSNGLTGNDVRIVRYKYKRITGNDDLQRKRGDGAIIVSLTLEKYNQRNKKEEKKEKYQYIICNYDSPRIKLGNISKNEASSVNQITTKGVQNYFEPLVNNMPINTIPKTSSTGQKYKKKINIDNLFLTYVSCDSIVYKYLEIQGDPSFYSCLWGKNKRLKTTNGITHNLTLEQINSKTVTNSYQQVQKTGSTLSNKVSSETTNKPIYQPLLKQANKTVVVPVISNSRISNIKSKYFVLNDNIEYLVNLKIIPSRFIGIKTLIKKILKYLIDNEINITVNDINNYINNKNENEARLIYTCIDEQPLSYESILSDLKLMKTFSQRIEENKSFDKNVVEKYYNIWNKISSTFSTQQGIIDLYTKLNKLNKK